MGEKKARPSMDVLGKISDPKKKSPPDGALPELKKGGESRNCR